MLWTICVFNYADRQAIFSVFPLLEREMNLTPVELGLLGSAFAWVYGLMAPLAGMVVDRVTRKTAILGGLQVWSLICMATALSQNFRHLFFFRAAEGLGETFYFPGLDVAHQRLPRPGDALARDGAAPDERLRGDDRRRVLRRPDRPALRLAAVVHRVRRARRPAGHRAPVASSSSRAAARRSGADSASDAAPTAVAGQAVVRRVPAPRRAHADAALPDGRVHVRELRRGRAALVDAEVPVRQVPHGPGDGGPDGDHLRPARQHGRRPARRLAGRHVAAPIAARPPRRADDRRRSAARRSSRSAA